MKNILSNLDVQLAAQSLASKLIKNHKPNSELRFYAVPRGGVPSLYALLLQFAMISTSYNIGIVDDPMDATHIVDDLVDSGATFNQLKLKYPDKVYCALYVKVSDKQNSSGNPFAHTFKGTFYGTTKPSNEWLVFPWEETAEGSAVDIVTRQLQYIGEDVTRQGLLETPKRVVKAWDEWFSGYNAPSDAEILKCFEDGAEGVDEMVIERNIPFTSFCEHHMAPFTGTANIAYIPQGKIVGLSKLNRITEKYARRLQVQERLTNEIAKALTTNLNPRGVAVLIKAAHSCVCTRGIKHHGCDTVTSALTGSFKNHPETRNEFLSLLAL